MLLASVVPVMTGVSILVMPSVVDVPLSLAESSVGAEGVVGAALSTLRESTVLAADVWEPLVCLAVRE